MSSRQHNAIKTQFPKFGIIPGDKPIDARELFSRQTTTILEIGFGMGDSLSQMAINNPDINYIGIEVHRPGVGSLLATIDENSISNIRVINHDAVEVLQNNIVDDSLDGIQVFFPDPWPKKRHFKRRLIQTPFIELLTRKLKTNGKLHIATDWKNYAEWIEDIMGQSAHFTRQAQNTPHNRPMTKFEKRGLDLGHGVWDMIYLKKE
jgi:tRNA (guanine-N7-)-methyltransferase